MFIWKQSITSYFPLILLQNIFGYLNRLRLVILIVKLPRVSFVALKGGIGIIIAHIGYLHRESVLVTTPIPNHKVTTSNCNFFHNFILLVTQYTSNG